MNAFDAAQTAQIEHAVSQHLRRRWQVQEISDLRDLSSHPAALLSDGVYVVFAKRSDATNGLDQLAREMAGLRLLNERAGIRTPAALGILAVAGSAIMLLEAVQTVERNAEQWREIGRTLARIHLVKGDHFGLENNGYFGPLFQDNRPVPANDWPAFFAERRLWPRLMSAIDAGYLPSDLIRQVERLIQRLPELCGPDVTPALLHGDAQKNNFISTASGAVVIDPAPYFGHPEFDLALVDYFEPVPEAVFDGYREVLPIDVGFFERRDLWRIYSHLAIVTLDDSPAYLAKLREAVQKYL